MAGLERQWRPGQRLPTLAELVGSQGQVGKHKGSVVKGCAAIEPTRGSVRSDEGEQAGAWENDLAVGSIEMHGSKGVVPLQSDDGRACAKRDVGVGLDSFDQIARHVLAEISAADDKRDRAPTLAQKDRRLAGRVATPDD